MSGLEVFELKSGRKCISTLCSKLQCWPASKRAKIFVFNSSRTGIPFARSVTAGFDLISQTFSQAQGSVRALKFAIPIFDLHQLTLWTGDDLLRDCSTGQ